MRRDANDDFAAVDGPGVLLAAGTANGSIMYIPTQSDEWGSDDDERHELHVLLGRAMLDADIAQPRLRILKCIFV